MAMTKPNIVQKAAAESNYTHGRTSAISQITFHHIVGDAPGALARFANPTQQVSSHYVIGSDGQIYGVVPENDTAWCDGNWVSNCRSISIEHAGGLPNVPYSDAMYTASMHLVAYLIDKYGIDNFKRHREVIDTKAYPGGTACCGDLDIDRIINGAKQLLSSANRPVPAPVSSASSGLGSVFLPAWVQSWALYRVGSGLRKGTEDQIATLCPAQFGGLTYKIVDRVGDKAVVIDTQMFGRGTIWTKDTDARFIQDTQPAPVQAPVAAAPAPAPAPAAPQVTVVPAPVARPQIVYSKLNPALDLVLNKDTHKWDLGFSHYPATSIEDLSNGTPFKAYGKAQHTDLDKPCYYMTEQDFGQADTTGAPANNHGVNTVDLSPAPAPAAATEPIAAPAAPVEPAAADEDKIQVTVVNDPNAWQRTFKPFLGVVDYVAQASTKVYDMADPDADPQQLVKDGIYKIAGTFKGKDGLKYYRTATSVKNGTWFAIPEACLQPKSEADQDNFVDEMLHQADTWRREAGNFTKREKQVIKAATIDGFLSRFKKKGVKK